MNLALVVFLVAFVLRAVVAFQIGDLPLSRTPQLDSREYVTWAQQLAAGDFKWPEYPEHAPGYPIFLALLLWITEGSLAAVRLIQAAVASLGCVLTARIASRSLRPDAFLYAGLLHATYAPLIYLDTAILAEPLLIVLALLAVDISSRATTRAQWMSAGVAVGAAAIVRPTGLVLLTLPLLRCAVKGTKADRVNGARRVAAFAVGAALVTLPVIWQNWRVTGVPLIQAYGGMNFYLGNSALGDGTARARPGGLWDTLEADATRAGVGRDGQDEYFVRKAANEALADPVGFTRVTLNKLLWVTQQEELRDTHSFHFFRDAMPLLAWLPGFAVVLALAAIACLERQRWTEPRWVLLPLIVFAATAVLLVVGLRYRAPMVPFAIALAGAGVASSLGWLRSPAKPRVRLTVAVVLGAVVFAAANLRTDERSHNLAEEQTLTALSLLIENHLAAADEAIRRAIALDAQSSFAWDVAGLIAMRRDDRVAAGEAFSRATHINPSNALAWHHYGLYHDRHRDHERALDAYRRAIEIAPERTDLVLSYGLALHRSGRLSEASSWLQTAAARGEGRAHFALALTAMQNRDGHAARQHAAEALRLMPDYAPARELVAAVQRLP